MNAATDSRPDNLPPEPDTKLCEYFRRFLEVGAYSTPTGRAACALSNARTILEWKAMEANGLVRLRALPEDDYFAIFGQPAGHVKIHVRWVSSEEAPTEIGEQIEADGACWVVAEYFVGQQWHHADSIGACIFDNPLSPFENWCVPGLARSAIAALKAKGEGVVWPWAFNPNNFGKSSARSNPQPNNAMNNKITLHTKASSILFSREIEIAPKTILCNDITPPGDFNPYNIRLWIVGTESTVLGAAWACQEKHPLDAIVDAGLGDCFLIDDKDADEATALVGNGSQPADLTHAWLAEVEFLPERDLDVIKRFDELRHSGFVTLEILRLCTPFPTD